jgi:hypothetical protein
MILFVDVILKKIFDMGKDCPMDPAGKVPLLRELENMGAWFCQYTFSRKCRLIK